MNKTIDDIAKQLKTRLKNMDAPRDILKAPELKELYARLPTLPAADRPAFGKAVNDLKVALEEAINKKELVVKRRKAEAAIDVTAPFDINIARDQRPYLLTVEHGSLHPLSAERARVASIFERMGFKLFSSREIDDDYHMFSSLNFPEGHPARDDYDTFVTDEGLVAPAHTSTMQNRIMREEPLPIRAVVIDRVFRNEDVDPKHEHTFNQVEGIYVDKNVTVGHLLATLKAFLEAYYETTLEVRTQPFYFPFVEPGFEFALSCPFCHKKGCSTCKYEGWIELLGCGLIHPNVLEEAGIDAGVYSGFAWGFGLDRLVMMKHAIEDIRYFQSGKLEFLRQFK